MGKRVTAPNMVGMRVGLEDDPKTWDIACRTGKTAEETVFNLYRLASWMREHGKYGKLKFKESLIDNLLGVERFAESLVRVGWLKQHDGWLVLKGFCDVAATRKSLGKKQERLS